jgi:cytochrome P450
VDPEAAKLVLRCPQIHKVGLSLSNVSSRYRQLFKKNVLEVDGDDWRRFRNILNPGFSNEIIDFFYPLISTCTDQAITKIEENQDLETWDFFSRFTLDLLGKTIFNYDFHRLDGENDQLYRSYKTILSFSITRTGMANMLFPFIEMLPFEGIRNFNKAADFFVKFFSDVIDEMKKKSDDKSILSRLLSEQSAEKISKEELISNIWMLFLAGHDTTTLALASAVNCLRTFPRKQEKLYQEIKNKFGTDRVPTIKELNELDYMDRFISEVLRLHSPVPILTSREATEDIRFNDQFIAKGTRVGILFHSLMTNPEYWEDPLKFSPKRFTAEKKKQRHHFLNIPFSAGPRQCLGTGFSLIEQKIFLVRLLQKYQVVDPVEHKPYLRDRILQLTLFTPINVRFVKR